MTEELIADIRKRYSAALDAKPGKGDYNEKGIDALTDSVCDIPVLLRMLEAVLDVTESDLVWAHQDIVPEGSLPSHIAFVAGVNYVREAAIAKARGYSAT